jgi:glycosyltransferase involved in cell wall biosynthesis
MAVATACEVWADSQATIKSRIPSLPPEKCRVISFATRRFEDPPERAVEPSFIFWGRLAHQKAIDRAIRLFAAIHRKNPAARFWVVGPDGGELPSLQALCGALGLQDAVIFLGAATQNEIAGYARQASFYLQTSVCEGMAMSVAESMQMGLVPVVTPAGEISAYCRNGHNAVVIVSDEQAVEDVLEILDSDDRYQRLRSNALVTWKSFPLYRDSVLSACESLLGQHGLL